MDHRLAFGWLVIQAMLDAFSPGQQLDHFLLIGVDIRGGLVNDFEPRPAGMRYWARMFLMAMTSFCLSSIKLRTSGAKNVMVLEIGVQGLGPAREHDGVAPLVRRQVLVVAQPVPKLLGDEGQEGMEQPQGV